jgi:predicted transcriptional regulator
MDDSILDPFQVKKRKRMESIKSMLAKLKAIGLKDFIANVSINCGIDRITVRKYLDELETANYIEIRDGIITWKG